MSRQQRIEQDLSSAMAFYAESRRLYDLALHNEHNREDWKKARKEKIKLSDDIYNTRVQIVALVVQWHEITGKRLLIFRTGTIEYSRNFTKDSGDFYITIGETTLIDNFDQ